MEIIFVLPSLKTGGGNRVFIELANILCNTYPVTLIAPNNSQEKHSFVLKEQINIQVIGRYTNSRIGKLINIISLIKHINKKYKKASIICTDPIFCTLLPLFKTKNLYRFIQADDYRIFDDGAILGKGLLLKIYKKMCLISFRNKNVKFIFNSRYIYDNFLNDSQRKDVKYDLVHPALNHRIFTNTKIRTYSSNNQLSICLVARKHPWKGLQTFINVYKKLPDYIKLNIKQITLISHDNLSSYDTSGFIIVKPKSDFDISEYYNSSDIFISTSWWEGFGLPPLEAMACGCAVICSKSGGVNEYVKDNINCLLYEPKNEIELQECIIKMIQDVKLRKELSLNGIKTANNFKWEISAQQFINIISKQ